MSDHADSACAPVTKAGMQTHLFSQTTYTVGAVQVENQPVDIG